MPSKPQISEEASKILQARRDAAAELKAIDGQEREINSYSVRRLASARLFADNIELRIASGEVVTSAEAKAADEMVEAARQCAKDDAPIGVTVRYVRRASGPVTASGAPAEVALTLAQVRALGRAEAAAEAAAKKLMPPPKVGPDHPEAKPQQAASQTSARPTPKPMSLQERNASFHNGSGLVREMRMSDGWMSNMGAMSRRRNENNRTHYTFWENPTREQ